MIHINIGDEPAKVYFQHVRGVYKNSASYTHCIIQTTNHLWNGQSRCAQCENFDKNKGRKLALARALSFVDRPNRKPVWDAYFAKRGGRY